MPFTSPKQKSGETQNALAGGDYYGANREFELVYRGKDVFDVGDSVLLRFMSLHPDDILKVPEKKVSVTNPKTKKLMEIKVHNPLQYDPVPEGADELTTLKDHSGAFFEDCQDSTCYRVPVFVRSITSGTGKNRETEDVDRLLWVELGPGLKKSLNKMAEANDGICAFNEESGRPEYDVRLKIVKGTSGDFPKTYEFEAVVLNGREPDANFDVSAEDCVDLKVIEEDWDAVQEEMRALMTVADVKKKLRTSSNSSGRPSLSSRPSFGGDDEEAGNVTDAEDIDVEAEVVADEPKKKLFKKRS